MKSSRKKRTAKEENRKIKACPFCEYKCTHGHLKRHIRHTHPEKKDITGSEKEEPSVSIGNAGAVALDTRCNDAKTTDDSSPVPDVTERTVPISVSAIAETSPGLDDGSRSAAKDDFEVTVDFQNAEETPPSPHTVEVDNREDSHDSAFVDAAEVEDPLFVDVGLVSHPETREDAALEAVPGSSTGTRLGVAGAQAYLCVERLTAEDSEDEDEPTRFKSILDDFYASSEDDYHPDEVSSENESEEETSRRAARTSASSKKCPPRRRKPVSTKPSSFEGTHLPENESPEKKKSVKETSNRAKTRDSKKQHSESKARSSNRLLKRKSRDLGGIESSSEEPPKKIRKYRNAKEENRSQKQCPYCSFVTTQHMARHLRRKHMDVLKTKKRVTSVASSLAVGRSTKTRFAPCNTITESAILEIYDDYLSNSACKEKADLLCQKLNVKIVRDLTTAAQEENVPEKDENEDSEEPQSDEDNDEHLAEDEEEKDASVKALRKKHGLHVHMHENYFLCVAYKAYLLNQLLRDPKSTGNSVKRVSQMLGFSFERFPKVSVWDVLVNTDIIWLFMEVGEKQCNTSKATTLIFIKDISTLCAAANDEWRPKKMFPSMPQDDEYQRNLLIAVQFWKQKKKLYSRTSKKEANAKLAAKKAVAADLNACYDYLEDKDVIEKMKFSMKVLQMHKKTYGKCIIKGNHGKEQRAWNYVIQYLAMYALIRNSTRNGVVENATIAEFEAAEAVRGMYIVSVAKQKTEETSGPAHLNLCEIEFGFWSQFLPIRKSMPIPKKENKSRVFVTINGEPYKNYVHYINIWMTKNGYPRVTANSIRKATATAAQRQDIDIQHEVSSHMKHTLATSQGSYRCKDVDWVVQTGLAVQVSQENYRAWMLYRDTPFEVVTVESLEFPQREVLEQIFAKRLRRPAFRLTEKTYLDMKSVWETKKRLQEHCTD